MALRSLPSPADPQPTFRDRTLTRLAAHVRTLVPVRAVAFMTADPAEPPAGWFADEGLRDALGGAGLVRAALERERPLLLPRVDAWEAAPDLLAGLVEKLGPARAQVVWRSFCEASVIACPVRTELGEALGVLAVASADPARPLRHGDVRTVEAVADMAAMALDRARLLEDEAARAHRELRLKRAGEAMSSSLELDDVYRSVVEHAAGVTGASRALLTRLSVRAGEMRTVASLGSLEGGDFGHVARTRRPVLRGTMMHAPIELGPRLYGVLSVGLEPPGSFDEDDLDVLARLARSSAAAIANAIDFERERRIARALTLGFVPESLPALPGYETGLLYAPALGEATGGDVYGAWRLPGGDMAVLVGDVAGKGVATAALSSMVRFFVEARSWDSDSPAEVLAQANAMLGTRLSRDTFVTAFLGVLSPGGLRYCNAGHLPPLHVSGDSVRELGGHGLPLGVEAEGRYGESEVALAEGDLVFAYTDGLTEARRETETFGAERLTTLVRALGGHVEPQALVEAIHEEIGEWSAGLADDAVALALRRRR